MAMNLQSMAQALNNVEKRELYYAGNLRRDKKLKSLSHHHFIVPDCDDLGNLLPAYVFVHFIGIKKSASIDHLLICNEEAERKKLVNLATILTLAVQLKMVGYKVRK